MTDRDSEIGWSRLAGLTPARIALGRSGAGLPTHEVLKFAMAHAQARDAVHVPFDAVRLASEIESLGFPVQHVSSAAPARDVYLRRPDLGRRLDDTSARVLDAMPIKGADLAIVIGDGLSSMAVGGNAAAFVDAMVPHIQRLGLHLAPVVIASGARVALGDEVGERLGARMVLVLIGERPGLSSPDSLGAYLTFGPRVGRTDAERNCISNIRSGGLAFDVAAFKLAWLIEAAFVRGLTGVSLKDESSTAIGWDSKTTIAAP